MTTALYPSNAQGLASLISIGKLLRATKLRYIFLVEKCIYSLIMHSIVSSAVVRVAGSVQNVYILNCCEWGLRELLARKGLSACIPII